MIRGEEFEIKCFEYLIKKYKNKNISFHREGGMDSTKSDIAVIKDGITDFYIEVKDTKAQSGQFVLIPNEITKKFEFSTRNKSKSNEITKIIIEYMNKEYKQFCEAGTSGKTLNLDASIFSKWIMNHYNEKKVKYIISYLDDFVILPIHKFSDYFEVSSTYRAKKSGSQKPSHSDISEIIQEIRNRFSFASFSSVDNHHFVKLNKSIVDEKFTIGKYTYFLSEKAPHFYEIRKLSNTRNMNVIFSIKLIKTQDLDDLKEFETDLV